MSNEDMIEQHEKRISSVEESLKPLYGIPLQLNMLIESINNLSEVSPTKELCKTKHESINKEIKDMKEEINDLKDDNKWLKRGLIIASLVVIWDIIKFIAPLIVKVAI